MGYEPTCFGEEWESQATECFGGLDPTFTNENGSKIRKRCKFYDSCAARVTATRLEGWGKQQSLPIQQTNAWKPPVAIQAPPRPTLGTVVNSASYAKPAATYPQYAPLQVVAPQPQMQQVHPHYLQPPQYQPQVQYAPQQIVQPVMMQQPMIPANYSMPSYLTAPETEGGFIGRLLTTVGRSMAKSAGHSVAHMFDSIPLLKK